MTEDTLGMFGEEQPPERYRASFWLFQSTKGVFALGGLSDAVAGAQERLSDVCDVPLAFAPVEDPDSSYANVAYKNRWNVAVVSEQETGRAISAARLPEDWFPLGDPRRI